MSEGLSRTNGKSNMAGFSGSIGSSANRNEPLPVRNGPDPKTIFEDEDFLDQLTALLIRDAGSLQLCGELLTPDDFKPLRGMRNGRPRWLVAERALAYYKKHGHPIDKLILSDVIDYASKIGMSDTQIGELKAYCRCVQTVEIPAPEAITDKVARYKTERLRAAAIQELAELQSTGQLTSDKWRAISERVLTIDREEQSAPLPQWPDPMQEAAYYGLAGEIVRAIEPHTEADPAALLIQTLLVFGNVIGRRAYWQVESTRHYTNLFAVLVGQTSKARKGTSLDRVLDLFTGIDEKWLTNRKMGGLSTGEGLIQQVRDPVSKSNKAGQNTIIDEGEIDKRLLITEPEFARVLRVETREASTLSMLLRDAWDKGDLRTLTKESPLRATGAHVSLIGHITEEELRRSLTDTARANGFANRFLWLCVRRSKSLPRGGNSLKPGDLKKLSEGLRQAVHYGQQARRIPFGNQAGPIWDELYGELSAGRSGLLGAVTDRAEAQVRRLACLYALLDQSSFIKVVHLRAALELWRYCFDSARFIFGEALGDPIADAILKKLRSHIPDGMTRAEISIDLFHRKKTSDEIGRALQSLLRQGMLRMKPDESSPRGGRPSERWSAV